MGPFWLSDPMVLYKGQDEMRDYWQDNVQGVSMGLQWDAFKAVMRGSYMSGVCDFKKANDSNITLLSQKPVTMENQYVPDPSSHNYHQWKDAQRTYNIPLTDKTQKKLLYEAQHIFELADKNGCLLAFLSKPVYEPFTIPRIIDSGGVLHIATKQILDAFLWFYTDHYAFRATYEVDELSGYLNGLKLPTLSMED